MGDIAYCQWFVANGVTHGKLGMIQFLSFLEARRPKTVWQETMTYGKHKGMSYEDMFMNDLPYCEWVRQRDPLFAAKTDRTMRLFTGHLVSKNGSRMMIPIFLEWTLNISEPAVSRIRCGKDPLVFCQAGQVISSGRSDLASH